MAGKAVTKSVLILRIFALMSLAASVVLLATDDFKLSNGLKATFKDVITYRFVLAAGVVGCAYTLLQLPFATYHVCTEKRLIRNGCLPEFDFYGDKITCFLLASGVGAGFAFSFEAKKLLKDLIFLLAALEVDGLDEFKSKSNKFLHRASIATGFLLLGFVCMAVLSVLSSISRTWSNGRGFFK